MSTYREGPAQLLPTRHLSIRGLSPFLPCLLFILETAEPVPPLPFCADGWPWASPQDNFTCEE